MTLWTNIVHHNGSVGEQQYGSLVGEWDKEFCCFRGMVSMESVSVYFGVKYACMLYFQQHRQQYTDMFLYIM